MGEEIWLVLAVNAGVVLFSVLTLWFVGLVIRDVSIIDTFFPLMLLLVTVVSYFLGRGASILKELVLVLVGIWALRLATLMIMRKWGEGEDPRYTKLCTWVDGDRDFAWLSLRQVFLLQGSVVWAVSIPVQVSQVMTAPTALGWIAYLGVVLWVGGFFFEFVADIQLSQFRKTPALKGQC